MSLNPEVNVNGILKLIDIYKQFKNTTENDKIYYQNDKDKFIPIIGIDLVRTELRFIIPSPNKLQDWDLVRPMSVKEFENYLLKNLRTLCYRIEQLTFFFDSDYHIFYTKGDIMFKNLGDESIFVLVDDNLERDYEVM